MVIIVKDVLFSKKSLRKICSHLVLKMKSSKILPSHPMTIPTLLMLLEIHSLSIKTPLCGNGAQYGYNCPSKVPIIPNPEPFNNLTIKELPPAVQSFDPKSDLVHNSPNVFSQSLQPPICSYESCGNDAYYGQDCSLQVLVTYDLEPCYNQDFNFP
nr:hypothetical protein [Tanacetum cinerariifolium]